MSGIELAAEMGYGVPWLKFTLTLALLIATAFFIYVLLSTKYNNVVLKGIDKKKYERTKYTIESVWGIFVAGLLVWFWILGYPWMPPVAFEKALNENQTAHIVNIIASQWNWELKDIGYTNNIDNKSPLTSNQDREIKVKAGETVKFVAHSEDVNHGFSILSNQTGVQIYDQMGVPLLQMQVVPGDKTENIFYYTFKEPGVYLIRCLEYCGWSHPFMVSDSPDEFIYVV
jgi:heme/copper-type cytochrome/quinol oxidase subunit 2